MNTEVMLIAAVASIAARDEPESTREMARGPASLQKRSIRRICAFIVASRASSVPEITTVQSRSTETVLSTALSFSIQARTDNSVNARVLPSIECAHCGNMRRMRNPAHESTTGRRCPTLQHQLYPGEESRSRSYLSIVAPPSDGQLYRCTIRARERARLQKPLVPMHTPTLAIESWDKYWQERGMPQIRTISSSTPRVHARCIVDGGCACAPPLTVVAVCSHRRLASASARLHCRVIVILRANAHGSHVLVVTSRWCSMSMGRLGGQIDPYVQRYSQAVSKHSSTKLY
jgi:hypothetical protein